jgi:5'(3')-deoxyribonucleotidase
METTMTTGSLSDKPRVLIDVDDVIVNFKQVFISAVTSAGLRNIDHTWRRSTWDLAKDLGLTEGEESDAFALINLPGVADRMMFELPGAVAGVKSIIEIADVYFVTSPSKNSPTWSFDRRNWLVRHFGEEQGSKVCHVHDKFIVSGDFLVDDKPENVLLWKDAWPLSTAIYWSGELMPRAPRSDILVANAWPQVRRFVEMKAAAMAPAVAE